MSELTYITSALRLPIVMILANRTLSGPLSIWNDHSDVMSIRDCGWIQIFTENGQDVYDQVFCAYKMAEKREVLFPVIINMDGFTLSHVIEPIGVAQEKVDAFLPYEPCTVYPTVGHDKSFALPSIFTETKQAHEVTSNFYSTYCRHMEGFKRPGATHP
jgi:pyruvate ferredoxin oxidoreductase alpha subunit